MNKKNIFAVLVILIALILFFMLRPHRVSGDCMEPAIKNHGLYFVNELYYNLFPLALGDIITFDHENKVWISRVVALENQTIEINGKGIFIDGNLYSDSVDRDWQGWKLGVYGIENAYKLGARHCYVLSDKLSSGHDDSRVFGPISYASIRGKVW